MITELLVGIAAIGILYEICALLGWSLWYFGFVDKKANFWHGFFLLLITFLILIFALTIGTLISKLMGITA